MRPADLDVRRAVVIAPHPDDESLGCGGLIAGLAAAGAELTVVFVTDGGASHRGSTAWPRDRLADQRRGEALEALAALGLGPETAVFLDLPDAAMPAPDTPEERAAQARLWTVMTAARPELVVAPWRRDPHCDHRDAWRMTQEAIAGLDPPPVVWEYAVWLDELGASEDHPRADEARRIDLDVAEHLPAKRAAVACHFSQLGGLIDDDPTGFVLTPATLARLVGPVETYWRGFT